MSVSIAIIATCIGCGSDAYAVDAYSADAKSVGWDYLWRCTDPRCKNHPGESAIDQYDPDWIKLK